MQSCNAVLIQGTDWQRFEHKTTDKTSAQKIDAPIRFPASLNMAPYTTLVMNGNNGKAPSSS